MRLFEYQAKEAFAAAGIAIPDAAPVIHATAEDSDATFGERVRTVAAGFGTGNASPLVVKSQVLMGGRGKAGLIAVVDSSDAAGTEAARMFSSGHSVRTILLERAVEARRELYLSVSVDPVHARAVILSSSSGGIDIEELARTFPDRIVRREVDMAAGLQPYQARAVAYDLGLDRREAGSFAEVVAALYRAFCEHDAELAEINPLFDLGNGAFVAGDGKLMIDDNSLFRLHTYTPTRDYFDSDTEFAAAEEGIPYLQFDGDISLMCAGAGLTTTVFDLVHYEGGTIANYLEFGGPNYRKADRAMELCLANESKVILVVTFGTIARADVMAQGVVDAIAKLQPDRPIVTCIRGTNEEAAARILTAAGLEPLFDTEEAVRRAVAIAAGGHETPGGNSNLPPGGDGGVA